jgi:hypothetical protein
VLEDPGQRLPEWLQRPLIDERAAVSDRWIAIDPCHTRRCRTGITSGAALDSPQIPGIRVARSRLAVPWPESPPLQSNLRPVEKTCTGQRRARPDADGNDLVDEFGLMIHPIAMESGRRLFKEGNPKRPLRRQWIPIGQSR